MNTINNTHEDNIKRVVLYAAKVILLVVILWILITCLIKSTIRQETSQEQQIEEMKAEHSDKGIVEENTYLDILVIRR